jgi:hypothetical protein
MLVNYKDLPCLLKQEISWLKLQNYIMTHTHMNSTRQDKEKNIPKTAHMQGASEIIKDLCKALVSILWP